MPARKPRKTTASKARGATKTPSKRSDPLASLAVPADRLRWRVDPAELGFATTEEIDPVFPLEGDERALAALRLGAEIDSKGYNVFCLGLEGEDRLELVRDLLRKIKPACRPARDHCFVHGFRQPAAPRLLELPAGQGRRFQRDVADLVDQLRKHLGLVFEEEAFGRRVAEITSEHQERERELLARLREQAEGSGFTLAQIEREDGSVGVDLLFRLGHHLVAEPDLERLVLEARAGLPPQLEEDPEEDQVLQAALLELDLDAARAAHEALSTELRRSTREARRLARAAQREVARLERQESLVVVEGTVAELASRHQGHEAIRSWLQELKADVLEHLDLFKPESMMAAEALAEPGHLPDPMILRSFADLRERFRVNLVHEAGGECTVFVESIPSVRNLFGSLGRADPRAPSDHRSIRTGSLLAADGGYLVLDAADVIAEPGAWRALKRVLLSRKLDLREAIAERDRDGGPILRPDPIPISTKVVLVGDDETYEYLHHVDPDFQHAFKVRAEFDWLVARGPGELRRLAGQVRRLALNEGLPPFSASAVAALAEHAARLGETGGRMASSFHLLADPCRQAAWLARREERDLVEGDDVRAALTAAERRCALSAERQREAIHERKILIATQGSAVGEINGLAVISTIEHSFGYPVRITAVAAHGTSGLINIEREARMSGEIHDKGMFIVQGYLNLKYGHAVPLSLTASVAFEQLYGGIDGDSATAAEIYALISALSDTPLRRSIAVTGSANQAGEVQPVGGVNEKIEGFYDACVGLAGGPEKLPGDQGVLIPASNVSDLMLRSDVVEAVRDGRFAIWAMEVVDEGLELLTGREAGAVDPHGHYPAGSLHAEVLGRLEELHRAAAQHGGEDGPEGPKAG